MATITGLASIGILIHYSASSLLYLTPRVPQQNKAQRAAPPVFGRFNLTKFAHL